MNLSEIEEKLESLSTAKELTPIEAVSKANEIVEAINNIVEVQVKRENYETLEELYEKASDAYLLAAKKVPRESRDKVAFPANYWSMRAKQMQIQTRKSFAIPKHLQIEANEDVYTHPKNLLYEDIIKKVGKVDKIQLNIKNIGTKTISMLERYTTSKRKKRIIGEPAAITKLAGDPCNITHDMFVNTQPNVFLKRNTAMPSWSEGATVGGGEAIITASVGKQAYCMENVNE